MAFVDPKGAIMNQMQAAAMFPVSTSEVRTAPAMKPGLRFESGGHTLILEASSEHAEAFRRGEVELRLVGQSMLLFGLAVRFRTEDRITPWFLTPYSHPYDPNPRKALPVDCSNPRMLPEESRRLAIIMLASGSRETIGVRHLVVGQGFGWALDKRVADSRHATQKPGYLETLTRQLVQQAIPERSDPRMDVVGTAVDAPPSS
jgi:hypothetical protein